jgi:peptidoglycan/xylan/chitin deacetylase (PgdA/CDA1 family)
VAPTSAGAPSAGSPPASRIRAALPPEVTSGPQDRPKVALTFHGQGDPALCTQLLGELERANARVTVLAVGSWLVAQPAMARRILDGGHELGNHTQNHGPLASMDAAHVYAEINACAQVLTKLTGSIGTWFRPSQTEHMNATIHAQLTRVGYKTCLSYDVDSLDYTDPPVSKVVDAVSGGVGNGSIVSLHFGHAVTLKAIPQVLDGLRQRGLTPVTMTELMSP